MNNYAAGQTEPRVGIVYRLYQPGGVQSVVLSLIKGLNQRGITPDLIWDTPPSQKMLAEKKVTAGYLPVRFRIPSPALDHLPISLAYLLRTQNILTPRQISKPYDFYYIFYNGFLVNDGTPHVRYLSGPPLIAQLETVRPGWRGLPFRLVRGLYQTVLRKTFPAYEFHQGSPYVINAEFTAQLFEEEHGTRLPVVHPPIDLAGRSFTDADIRRRDTITFFSRFVDFKRPELFLELACRHPEYRYVAMGGVKPAQRAYFESLRASADGSNVHFFENPSDERVKEELARTRVYVFPAVNEHFGMATVEAIGSGALPYVHDSGGQREIVPDERLRFQDEHIYAGFDALLRLTDEEINVLRHKLHDHVQNFSEEIFIQKMLSFLP